MRSSLSACEDQIAERVDRAGQAGIDHGRRVRLLEYGRPLDLGADQEIEPRPDARVVPDLAEAHAAVPEPGSGHRARRRERREIEMRASSDGGRAQRDDANGNPRKEAAELG